MFSYFAVAFYPFVLRPYCHNGVRRSEGAIQFPAEGIVHTDDPPDWLQSAIRQNDLVVNLRCQSLSLQQRGPARIFTISQDPYRRNLTIGQENSNLILRLRTPDSSLNGLPAYSFRNVFEDGQHHDLHVSIQSNKLSVSVDGSQLLSEKLPADPMQNWDSECRVALGNELTGDRPWLGNIERAAIRIKGQSINLLDQPFQKPEWYFPGFQINLLPSPKAYWNHPQRWRDAILNFACFVPLGMLLVLTIGETGRWLWPAVLCSSSSALVEVGQVFVALRYPSVLDWILNTVGALCGAYLMTRVIDSNDYLTKARSLEEVIP